MTPKLADFLDKIILYLYFALVILTPIIFTTQTTELYEVPKMFFVYTVSLMILFLTVAKFMLNGKITLPKNPVLTPFAIFVAIQVISTFFSIDKYTSIFGFPTRLNGGLVSQFAYLAIFAAALVNLSKDSAKKILITIVATALFVSLWGIPSHFDKDPSCLLLAGRLTSGCWQADFNPQLRIFSTLGQPNWLASYLTLIIPIALAFSLSSAENKSRLFFATIAIITFTALVLTNSRSGVLGAGLALVIFLLLIGKKIIIKNLKVLLPVLAIFALVGLIFGTAMISRTTNALVTVQTKSPSSNHPTRLDSVDPRQTIQPSNDSNSPTESFKIRLIVWQGALRIFKRWPALGSGPETFVSSYFMLRPAIHNQTSEWEFYYNKAHNEFLNYLANTGALGFLAHLAFILAIFYTLFRNFRGNSQQSSNNILTKATFTAIFGYLVTLFFGFSTVATQVTLFIMLASVIITAGKDKGDFYQLTLPKIGYRFALSILFSVAGLFALSLILRAYFADVLEKRAQALESINTNKAQVAYRNALATTPFKNPYLMSDYANTQASYLADLKPLDAQSFAKRVDILANAAYDLSQNNYLIVQKVAKTYLLISDLPAGEAGYSETYKQKTTDFGQKLIKLAPTYPDSWLTLAKIQIVLGKNQDAINSLNTALDLKTDYVEAKELLDELNSKSYNN